WRRVAASSDEILRTDNRERLRSENSPIVRELVGCESFQCCLVADHQRRSLGLHNLPLLQLRKQTRHSLTRGPDHLGNLLVGKGHFQSRLSLGVFGVSRAPVEQQLGKFFGRRVRKSERTDFSTRGVVLVAELLGYSEACIRVFAKETKEVFTLHEVNLARIDGLGREFVGFTGNGRAQTEYFPGFGDLEDQGLAVGRADRQLYSSLAENENPAWRLSFYKEDCTLGIGRRVLDGFERLERVIGEVAKDMLRPHFAAQAAFYNVQPIW